MTLVVVHGAVREADLPVVARGYARDTITLGWEDRRRGQGRRVSDAGIEFGVSLPRGQVLGEGDCFVLDALSRVIVVKEAHEDVFIIEPQTQEEWARYAYQIGNRHQPLMVTSRELVCPAVPGMQLMLDQTGVPYRPGRRPVRPMVAGGAHHHAH